MQPFRLMPGQRGGALSGGPRGGGAARFDEGAPLMAVKRSTMLSAFRVSGYSAALAAAALLLTAALTLTYRQQYVAAEAQLAQLQLATLTKLWLAGLSLEATLMADVNRHSGMGATFQRQEEIENEMHENVARRLRALAAEGLPEELRRNGTALLKLGVAASGEAEEAEEAENGVAEEAAQPAAAAATTLKLEGLEAWVGRTRELRRPTLEYVVARGTPSPINRVLYHYSEQMDELRGRMEEREKDRQAAAAARLRGLHTTLQRQAMALHRMREAAEERHGYAAGVEDGADRAARRTAAAFLRTAAAAARGFAALASAQREKLQALRRQLGQLDHNVEEQRLERVGLMGRVAALLSNSTAAAVVARRAARTEHSGGSYEAYLDELIMQAMFTREGCTAADAPHELQQQLKAGIVDAAVVQHGACKGSAAELGAWAEAWRLREATALHILQRAGKMMESEEQAAPLYAKWLVSAFTPPAVVGVGVG
jgi:hypothetical protein